MVERWFNVAAENLHDVVFDSAYSLYNIASEATMISSQYALNFCALALFCSPPTMRRPGCLYGYLEGSQAHVS